MKLMNPQIRTILLQSIITVLMGVLFLITGKGCWGWMFAGQIIIEVYIFFGVIFKIFLAFMRMLSHAEH
jgi:hypothetical protein